MLRLTGTGARDRLRVCAGTLAAVGLGSALTLAAVQIMLATQAATTSSDVRAAAAGSYLLGLLTVVVTFATVCVVANGMSYLVALRAREFGLLRAVGATPAQVRRLVLGEAAGLGIIGGCAGALASPAVAVMLAAWLSHRGMTPEHLDFRLRPGAVVAGATSMVGVAVLAAWPAAWRCGRIAPTRALAAADLDRGAMTAARWLFGSMSVAGAALLARAPTHGNGGGRLGVALCVAVLAVAGLALLAPALAPRLVALTLLPGRPWGVGWIAVRTAGRAVRRTAALTVPPMLVVAMVTAIGTVIGDGGAARTTDPTDSSNMNPAFLTITVTVLAAYASVAVAGIAVLATDARAGELSTLRAGGATLSASLAVVGLEALAATVVGAALGCGSLAAATAASGGSLGRLPWPMVAAVTLCCTSAAVLAGAATARRHTYHRP